MPFADLNIYNTSPSLTMVAYRTVTLVFDHAAMVAAGRSRADGRDLKVVWFGTNPALMPVHVMFPNTTTTRLFFCLKAAIPPSGSSIGFYFLGYGNLDYNNPAPVPIRDKSQFHPYVVVSPGGSDAQILPAAQRIQPFFFYDAFTHRWAGGLAGGGQFVPYMPLDQLDNQVWRNEWGVDWLVHDTVGSIRIPKATQSTLTVKQNHLSVATPPNAGRRIRAWISLLAGAVNPRVGLTSGIDVGSSQANSLTCTYLATNGEYPSVAFGELDAGSEIELGAATCTDLEGKTALFDLMHHDVASGSHNLIASVFNSGEFGPVGGAGYDGPIEPGLLEYSDGAAGAGYWLCHEFWWELWDGVLDNQVLVLLGPIVQPVLPSPAPSSPAVEHRVRALVDTTPYPDSLVVHRSQYGPHRLNRWLLHYTNIPPLDYYDIRALVLAMRGSSGVFTWTGPHGLDNFLVRIVPDSYRPIKTSFAGYHADIELEEVLV